MRTRTLTTGVSASHASLEDPGRFRYELLCPLSSLNFDVACGAVRGLASTSSAGLNRRFFRGDPSRLLLPPATAVGPACVADLNPCFTRKECITELRRSVTTVPFWDDQDTRENVS